MKRAQPMDESPKDVLSTEENDRYRSSGHAGHQAIPQVAAVWEPHSCWL